MKLPMFTKVLETKVIDGKVFVDLEHLVQLIFDISNESSIAATQTRDPALGVMTVGVATLGQALDAALEARKEAAGLTDRYKACSRSEDHPAHNWILARKVYRCKGIDQDD
ncbi:hypothetical protein SEA_TUNATARTARE_220 [Streptomyces phage TunaTartare]|uniref:Uncharacterized protein n=1 Tax=Streptomyces phage TunaTartare TaxID=2848887 RepID=A0A8F2E6W3_9CAUD|nr:hypothetical protein PP457_gp060 [Streptomyces phage TunaTartare]QWT30082.1 hypothetical protein SEA_TUNATARTARE_220 [Streptomyces phage TunaTartare]